VRQNEATEDEEKFYEYATSTEKIDFGQAAYPMKMVDHYTNCTNSAKAIQYYESVLYHF